MIVFAIAQAMDRSLATPSINPFFPLNIPIGIFLPVEQQQAICFTKTKARRHRCNRTRLA
jgi:hypothetical protein